MINLLRSEARKVKTTKLWWGMLLGAVALTALSVVAQIASNGVRASYALPLSSAITQKSIVSSVSSAYLFSLVVGIILITTEFRHLTSRPTFLIEPRRGRVILAKMVIAIGIGILYGIVCVAIAVGIMVPWLNTKGVSILWLSGGVLQTLLAALAVIAIFAVVGVGVGVLLRNQIASVVFALAFLFVIEPLVLIIPVIQNVYSYLPGAAASAITSSKSPAQVTLLAPWQGGLILFGWGLLFAFLGWVFTVLRAPFVKLFLLKYFRISPTNKKKIFTLKSESLPHLLSKEKIAWIFVVFQQ